MYLLDGISMGSNTGGIGGSGNLFLYFTCTIYPVSFFLRAEGWASCGIFMCLGGGCMWRGVFRFGGKWGLRGLDSGLG